MKVLFKLLCFLLLCLPSCNLFDNLPNLSAEITFEASTIFLDRDCENKKVTRVILLFDQFLMDDRPDLIISAGTEQLFRQQLQEKGSREYVQEISLNPSASYVQDSFWIKVQLVYMEEILQEDSVKVVVVEQGTAVEFIQFNTKRVPFHEGLLPEGVEPYHCYPDYQGAPLSADQKYLIKSCVQKNEVLRTGQKIQQILTLQDVILEGEKTGIQVKILPDIQEVFEIDPRFHLRERTETLEWDSDGKSRLIVKNAQGTFGAKMLLNPSIYVRNRDQKPGIPAYIFDYCKGGELIKGVMAGCDSISIIESKVLVLPMKISPAMLCTSPEN